MRYRPFGLAAALLLVLSSCGQQEANHNQQSADKEAAVATKESKEQQPEEKASEAKAPEEFDITKIPVSDQKIGDFPYLVPPEGYKYSQESKRDFEEKFFYYNDSLVRRVSGKYFYSVITKKENNTADYGKTFVLKSYEDAIKRIGGVPLYTGTLSDQARELLNKEKPEFFKDLSTNYAIRYKQYILRTKEANIWFELAVVDNEYELRLSVVREEATKP